MTPADPAQLDLASTTPDAVASALMDIRDEATRVADDARLDGDERVGTLAGLIARLADHMGTLEAASGPSLLSDDRLASEEDEHLHHLGEDADEG